MRTLYRPVLQETAQKLNQRSRDSDGETATVAHQRWAPSTFRRAIFRALREPWRSRDYICFASRLIPSAIHMRNCVWYPTDFFAAIFFAAAIWSEANRIEIAGFADECRSRIDMANAFEGFEGLASGRSFHTSATECRSK